jgi:hypothetical protein
MKSCVFLCVLALCSVSVPAETHREVAPLDIRFGRLSALRLLANGNLLAADNESREIKEISPDGKLVRTFSPGIAPDALAVAPNGDIYCAGNGKLLRLSTDGKILHTAILPPPRKLTEQEQRRTRGHAETVSGLAVSGPFVFAAIGSSWSVGSLSRLYRFDLNLGHETKLIDKLRACCQRCDLAARDNSLYIAENAVHRVVRCDHDGKVLASWGAPSRANDLEGFGSCCNPMNLCFGSDGSLYTAESGLARIKRYKTDGAFLNLVGTVGVERFNTAGHLAASCSNIAIAVTRDGRRIYVMDYKNSLIRVLEQR